MYSDNLMRLQLSFVPALYNNLADYVEKSILPSSPFASPTTPEF